MKICDKCGWNYYEECLCGHIDNANTCLNICDFCGTWHEETIMIDRATVVCSKCYDDLIEDKTVKAVHIKIPDITADMITGGMLGTGNMTITAGTIRAVDITGGT